jgi:hypothetical protein
VDATGKKGEAVNRKLPPHVPGTVREWRTRKRREFNAVMKALNTFRIGCAFTPVADIDIIDTYLTDNRKRLRGNWEPHS